MGWLSRKQEIWVTDALGGDEHADWKVVLWKNFLEHLKDFIYTEISCLMMEDCDKKDQLVLPKIMLEMMEQIGSVLNFSTCLKSASPSLWLKCFFSWHFVLCKQSLFGPWAGLSNSICRIQTHLEKHVAPVGFKTHSLYNSEVVLELHNPSGLLLLFFWQFHFRLPEVWMSFLFGSYKNQTLHSHTQNGSVSMKILSTMGGGGTISSNFR